MKRFVLLVVALVTGAALAQEPVRIGVITSLTGRFAEFGAQHQAGFAAALEDVNAAGGIDGRPVEIVMEDDTSDLNTALTAAEKLLGQDVPLILGAYSSSITNPLSQYFASEEFPFLVFTSSADNITRPGSEWVFRLNQPATAYAEVLFDIFDRMREEGESIDRIALIAGNGNFETAVADAAELLAEERGYEIVGNERYDRGVTDFRPVLNRFKSSTPDALFMVSYAEDAPAIMRQTKEVGLDAKVFAGGAAGFALPTFLEGAGDAAEYVITATAWTQDVSYPGAQSLYERLKANLGGHEPSYHAAQAYAGLITAVDALARSEDFAAESVRTALEATDMEETVYGPIRFADEDGYMNQNPIKMIAQQVQGGGFVTVFPDAAAVGELIFPAPGWSQR